MDTTLQVYHPYFISILLAHVNFPYKTHRDYDHAIYMIFDVFLDGHNYGVFQLGAPLKDVAI
jgi:hypothetical protein